MATFTIAVAAPHATPYDASYPTRSTENYAHALHTVLEDMKDAGWRMEDGLWNNTHGNAFAAYIVSNINEVFDYADQAITNYRADTPTALSEPVIGDLYWSISTYTYAYLKKALFDNATKCFEYMYKIYYMWETEDDPLLLKEKLQELLVAWPLTDSEIFLNEDGGQSIHIVPAWKNVDL